MMSFVQRRTVLTALAAVSGAALLAACSDSGEQKKAEATPAPAEPTATPATTTAPATPAPAEPAAPAKAVEAPKAAGTVDVAKLMEPGPLPEMVLGKADAPVTIVEYASMTCPHCAHFHETTLPTLTSKYIDTGKVRLVFREFPFDPRAEGAFMLARCSKDKYFQMVSVLFQQQQNWAAVDNAKDALLQLAKLAGFSQQTFEACLTDQKLLEDIRAVRERASKDFGVDSTPTFFINGSKYPGAMSIEEMSAIIDPLL
ncbi:MULTISPECIES: DsbA family protein [Mesorhizobium]|uniref:DsbA family protein n=1 Tax=Mesorhizobium denitrificans TaxID=2294114 RepID=A0A371XHX6_9HYPH|nr:MULTISPECIES: DsbA family protein [Mesorhizobium]RFC68831.1 DsbA family protein [Mesorhizobium denitrificans]